jgi:hypothetical protein
MTLQHGALTKMLQEQLDLQIDSYGLDPRMAGPYDDPERSQFISWNVLALTDELHEALNEVGWKPWATSRRMNVAEYRGELVDAFHFFMNLWMASFEVFTPSEEMAAHLLDGYMKKRAVNAKRQEDGYDGVAGKCPDCKRDLAEVGTKRSSTNAYDLCNGCNAIIVDDHG